MRQSLGAAACSRLSQLNSGECWRYSSASTIALQVCAKSRDVVDACLDLSVVYPDFLFPGLPVDGCDRRSLDAVQFDCAAATNADDPNADDPMLQQG